MATEWGDGEGREWNSVLNRVAFSGGREGDGGQDCERERTANERIPRKE